ncbi:MAG TPA: thioredoxin family protein [Draconibacterium sp.]|nr:thioredoxin family protein [Draconibacterium sp.]
MVKKILPWIVVAVFAAVFVAAFVLKDSMNSAISEMMKQQASPEMTDAGQTIIDSLYNYTANGFSFEITFLEFGSKGCSACARMEGVMDEITEKYPAKVNVVFVNVLKPESQLLMKYYGIAAIPTQVLLNKEGKEFFRHTGYISGEELASGNF